jgi:hypothetical protein
MPVRKPGQYRRRVLNASARSDEPDGDSEEENARDSSRRRRNLRMPENRQRARMDARPTKRIAHSDRTMSMRRPILSGLCLGTVQGRGQCTGSGFFMVLHMDPTQSRVCRRTRCVSDDTGGNRRPRGLGMEPGRRWARVFAGAGLTVSKGLRAVPTPGLTKLPNLCRNFLTVESLPSRSQKHACRDPTDLPQAGTCDRNTNMQLLSPLGHELQFGSSQ